jgi:hypothetical protein
MKGFRVPSGSVTNFLAKLAVYAWYALIWAWASIGASWAMTSRPVSGSRTIY